MNYVLVSDTHSLSIVRRLVFIARPPPPFLFLSPVHIDLPVEKIFYYFFFKEKVLHTLLYSSYLLLFFIPSYILVIPSYTTHTFLYYSSSQLGLVYLLPAGLSSTKSSHYLSAHHQGKTGSCNPSLHYVPSECPHMIIVGGFLGHEEVCTYHVMTPLFEMSMLILIRVPSVSHLFSLYMYIDHVIGIEACTGESGAFL